MSEAGGKEGVGSDEGGREKFNKRVQDLEVDKHVRRNTEERRAEA